MKFECIKAWIDVENDLAIPIGSVLEFIEIDDDGLYLLEVILGINDGFQMTFSQVQIAKHFKILPE